MLEPVQKASGRSRKLNSVVVQRTHSSAQPERCTAISDRSKTNSRAKSRSLDDVEAVGGDAVEAERRGDVLAVDRQRRAGQRGRPQRQDVDALAAVGQAVAVALELLDVGQEVVGRQDRLGPLQVRVAGQDQVAVPLGRGDEGPLQVGEPPVDPVEGVADPELDVGADLVVAAAAGVQLAADVAEAVDQRGLDVRVDVLALEHEREAPLLDLGPDIRQAPHNLLAFLGGEQSDLGEHPGVRDRAPDVVLEEPTVKGDRLRELFHAAVGFAAETSAPRLARHLLPTPGSPIVVRNVAARDG